MAPTLPGSEWVEPKSMVCKLCSRAGSAPAFNNNWGVGASRRKEIPRCWTSLASRWLDTPPAVHAMNWVQFTALESFGWAEANATKRLVNSRKTRV